MRKTTILMAASMIMLSSCGGTKQNNPKFDGSPGEVKIMTLNPGHFHAALIQKNMYEQVSPDVFVFAPEGEDVKMHLNRIQAFNTREENPTRWNEIVYEGPDYFERMLAEKPGNVVMLAGRNDLKIDYIAGSVENGLHVFADKPMVINREGYDRLIRSFDAARKNGVLLYDIMTERFEITNILQAELTRFPELFGELEKGTPDDPAIIKESVHHLFKYVSGAPNIRPSWFFDVEQQGEGIVDVNTHLVDLVQLAVVGENPIDIRKQIRVNSAKHWPTAVNPEQWSLVTGKDGYPDYLSGSVVDGVLQVYCNGEIGFELDGVHARVIVLWNFQAPEGGGDTHFSVIRGSKADIVIRQGAEQGYKPMLYVVKNGDADDAAFEKTLTEVVAALAETYPGLEVERVGEDWRIVIPQSYEVGHEAHFAQVTERFLQYLIDGKLPEWEVANMKSKYFITTTALEMARANDGR